MRIAVICNDRLGLMAVQQLLQEKLLVAVASSDRASETTTIIAQMAKAAGVPYRAFGRKDLERTLTEWLQEHRPDVVLVKTFPWRIPAAVLALPQHGFINFHYAPLPEWRGANPLFWMLRRSVPFGGVTVHRMDVGVDTGDILLKQQLPVAPDTTFGMLIGQLAYMGLSLTGPLLQGLMAGTLQGTPQDATHTGWYGRPKSEDLFIDWSTQTREEIRALVNACNPWNKGAGVRFNGWTFGITAVSFSASPVPENTAAGTLIALNKEQGALVACADGKAIALDIVYSEEGFFTGIKLLQFGLKEGNQLDIVVQTQQIMNDITVA